MNEQTRNFVCGCVLLAAFVSGYYLHLGLYGSRPKDNPAPLVEAQAGIGEMKLAPQLASHPGPIVIWPKDSSAANQTRLNLPSKDDASLPPMVNLEPDEKGNLVEKQEKK